MKPKLLVVKKLEKSFGGVKAVQDLDFDVEENSITALIGPNGSGKTTAFNLITGLIKADKGDVHFKGEPILGLPTHKIASLGIARTFQLIRLFPTLTCLENLLLAKRMRGENFFTPIFNRKYIKHEEKAGRERCMDFLKIVGLEDKADTHAENLSYGQRKLLELARCLAQEAELIMLDEPVEGVNPLLREKIKNLLLRLKKEEGKTILVIEHDMDFVMNLADKVVVMNYGEEIAIGAPEKIKKNKRVVEAYLGKKIK